MSVHSDDKQLVQRVLRGDEAAFDCFVHDYFGRLFRFASMRMPDDTVAITEIVHLTLSKALRKLPSYRGEAALFSWLCAICRRHIADWRAQQQRYHAHIVLTEDLPQVEAAVESLCADLSPTPDQQLQRVELVRLIQVALDRLPANYGDALEWKYVLGYSVKEIAERLELGFEAAQSLLARAKRAFREVYATLAAASCCEADQNRNKSHESI